MLIDPIPTTTHLKPVLESLRAIKRQVEDLEWHGIDATLERQKLDRLQQLWAAGVTYEPNF